MSILHRLTEEEIKQEFTHKGLLAGICPVYIRPYSDDDMFVCERNGIPTVWLYLVIHAITTITWLLNFGGLRPAFPNAYPIVFTGEIK